jgi:hypothetical protein
MSKTHGDDTRQSNITHEQLFFSKRAVSPTSSEERALLETKEWEVERSQNSGRGRSGSGNSLANARRRRFGESEPWGPQQEEKFPGPEQDVQKTPSLQIAQVLAMEADVERLPGTLLDKSSHGSRIERFRAEPAAPGIQVLKLFIATQQEVVQAKILLIQFGDRGARTRIHIAASFSMFRIHSTQAP